MKKIIKLILLSLALLLVLGGGAVWLWRPAPPTHDEIKAAAVAATARIVAVGKGVIVDASTAEIIRPAVLPIRAGGGFLILKGEHGGLVLTNARVLVEECVPSGSWEEEGKTLCFVPQEVVYLICFSHGENASRIYVTSEVACAEEKDLIDLAVLCLPPDGLPEALRIAQYEINETEPVMQLGFSGQLEPLSHLMENEHALIPLLAECCSKLDEYARSGGAVTLPLLEADRPFIQPRVSLGHIIRYDETPGKPQRVIHSAPAEPGSAGCPLVDLATGHVVGMPLMMPLYGGYSSVAQSAATIIGFLNSQTTPGLDFPRVPPPPSP